MKQPKNWLIGVILAAIIGFFVNWTLGTIVPSKSEMTYKLTPELLKIIEKNKNTNVFIVIEGKETKVKPNSDGEIKIKISKENDGKKAELKVTNEEGKELKKKKIILQSPVEGFPVTITTPDDFRFEFTDIEWKDNKDLKITFNTTNLGNKDRELKFNVGRSIGYTDVGTDNRVRSFCFNKKCTTYYKYGGQFIGDVRKKMPKDIFINCSLNIRGIDENTTMIQRLVIGYNKNKNFELTKISLPPIQ